MHIRLPGTLLHYVGHSDALTYDARTVRDALSTLVEEYPALGLVLLDSSGQVQRFHSLFLNGEQLRHDELDRPAAADDRLEVLTAIAGG
ncbi:MoaD/ThiS family protein [Actinoplanes sp. NPDC051346]|uniref:MoaD/ThiS family protein n=1 Tax=Actinoplanes sp. NPDC051346 TaxID=3155048 RepID=UPI0034463C36